MSLTDFTSTGRRGAPSSISSRRTTSPGSPPAPSSSTVRPESTDSGGSVLGILGRPGVSLLDEEPVLLRLLQLHQGPHATQLVAPQLEEELALGEPLQGVPNRDPLAAVPHDHRPGAVVSLRDEPLEVPVLERVILHVDREPLLRGVVRRALWGPPRSAAPLPSRAEGRSGAGGRRAGVPRRAVPRRRRRRRPPARAFAPASAWRGRRRAGRTRGDVLGGIRLLAGGER